MDDQARGWAIVWGHLAHGHHLGIWIAILASFLPIWIATSAARRKRKDEDADDAGMRPKPPAPLPGPDRGFR